MKIWKKKLYEKFVHGMVTSVQRSRLLAAV